MSGHDASLSSGRLKRAKSALRREILERRDRLTPAERVANSLRITERFLALPEMREVLTAMAFWSFGSEVQTTWLLEALHARGVRVSLPRIVQREVVPVIYAPGDPVTETAFGAMEPAAGEVLDPEQVEVVISPGVAFDRRGGRVGYGGGFYDRFRRRLEPGARVLALAFGVQIVEEVPAGRADLHVDAIITEDEVIRCPR